jgi:hypothetical protein
MQNTGKVKVKVKAMLIWRMLRKPVRFMTGGHA